MLPVYWKKRKKKMAGRVSNERNISLTLPVLPLATLEGLISHLGHTSPGPNQLLLIYRLFSKGYLLCFLIDVRGPSVCFLRRVSHDLYVSVPSGVPLFYGLRELPRRLSGSNALRIPF